MSWFHREDGYELFCNRDEKRNRGIARRPEIGYRNGVRFLAPQDADAGGTWIAVNEFGLSLCLLNGRAIYDLLPSASYLSRGLLVRELAPSRSLPEACDRAWNVNLTRFAPFTLLFLEPGRSACVLHWNGRDQSMAEHADRSMPLISSSFDPEGVRVKRLEALRTILQRRSSLDADTLLRFHASHTFGPNAYSTCMHRPDAETVSFSRVTVLSSQARFAYTSAAPCRHAPFVTRTLPLLH